MGQLIQIFLKTNDDKEIEAINKVVKKLKIKNHFITEKMNIEWVDDINNNPNSEQKHLKPTTLDELKETFSMFTKVGCMDFDVAFDRTSQKEAEKYANFILQYKDHIEYISNGMELIKKYSLSIEQVECIKTLLEIVEEPELLPINERTKEINGGILLCKSWGLEPFWVIYGNVDKPTYMINKKYKNDMYNSLYKDKLGYGYMLIPLLPLGNKSLEFAYEVYEQACEIGLRENPNYFLSIVYGLDLVNYNSVIEDYKQWYNQDEIIDRFEKTYQIVTSVYPYQAPIGIIWNDRTKRFERWGFGGNPTSKHLAYCSVLTCLVRAIDNKQTCADILTQCTGKRYLKFEF